MSAELSQKVSVAHDECVKSHPKRLEMLKAVLKLVQKKVMNETQICFFYQDYFWRLT